MEDIILKTRDLFQEISERQLKLGFILVSVKDLIENNEDYQESYISFKAFLAEVGKSEKQVLPFMNAALWCDNQGIAYSDVKHIPITKLNLMAQLDVPFDDELIYNLEELSYSDLKKKYGQTDNEY